MSTLPPRRPATAGAGPSASASTIAVWVEGRCHHVSVGAGGNTVRWLAQAALQRHAALMRPGGAVRAREPAADCLRAASGVHEVRAAFDDAVLGPDISVAELKRRLLKLGGPEAVAAGLRLELPALPPPAARGRLPHDAAPRAPLWHALAHHFSAEGRSHASALLADFSAEKARADALLAVRREEELQKQMTELGRLLVSDVEDEEAADSNFLYDWSNVRTKLVTADAEDAKKMRRTMRQHYLAVVDMFRHFSGGSSKGSTASMQKSEVVHMLVLAGALDILKERALIEKCFVAANAGRSEDKSMADDRDAESLTRYELMELLVLLSHAKHAGEVDMRSGQALGPAGALHKMLAERLAVLHNKLNAGPVRAALKEASIHKFLLPRLPILMRVYQYYAALDSDGPGGGAPDSGGGRPKPKKPLLKASLMDLDEFVLLLEHAGLLDDVTMMKTSTATAAAAQLKANKATLTAQEVRETFSGVQREDDGSGADDQGEELTFGEFLEAIGRAAIAKWGDAVGLKYVLDARSNAMKGGAASGQGAGALDKDLMAKGERVFVRALVMWAYHAVSSLVTHIGVPIGAPVQFDTNELARLVTLGMPDVLAAAAASGVPSAEFQGGPAAVERAESEAEAGKSEAERAAAAAGPGVEVYSLSGKHKRQVKEAFSTTHVAALPPRPHSAAPRPGTAVSLRL